MVLSFDSFGFSHLLPVKSQLPATLQAACQQKKDLRNVALDNIHLW
jgi:hypothetical protein